MAQVLSQEEIDALLGGLDEVTPEEDKEEKAPEAQEGDILPYDFKNAASLTRVRFPAFDVINDYFNRGLRTTLSSILRVVVDSNVVPTEVITFKEFLKRVPVPSNIHVLKMEPLRGHIIMVVDSLIVFSIVEIFLGASQFGKIRVEGREFTSIEQRLIKRVVNAILADLERAWRPIYPVTLQYIRSEINPQFAKIAQDDDTVIVSKYQLELEEITGFITMCIPLTILQPIKPKLQTAFQGEESTDPQWRQGVIQNLRHTELEFVVPLGNATISGAELLDLDEGDIIQLDTNIDEPLLAFVQGLPKFKGTPGVKRGQRAFKVESIITNPDDV